MHHMASPRPHRHNTADSHQLQSPHLQQHVASNESTSDAHRTFTNAYAVIRKTDTQESIYEKFDHYDAAQSKASLLNHHIKGSRTIFVVQELDLDQCTLPFLRRIALREKLPVANKSKTDLKALLRSVLLRKKQMYTTQQGTNIETDADDHKMYREQMLNPISQAKVTTNYKLSSDDLRLAIKNQQLHWQRRTCFGKVYVRFEKHEIDQYYSDLQSKKHQAKTNLPSKTNQVNAFVDPMLLVPANLRHFKWLYTDCNELSQDGRNKIIGYLKNQYTKNDIEHEDVLLNRTVLKDSHQYDPNKTVIEETIFRIVFANKSWKKLKIKKKYPKRDSL